MSDFEQKLHAMVAKELTGDADQIGTAIERLTNSLGLAVAVSSRGDAKFADHLLTGIDGYLVEAVAEHSKLARFINTVKACRDGGEGL